MVQILPSNTPTYETAARNWTRPDNVWLSHHALNLYTACFTDPAIRPTHADHLPIVTIIDMPVARSHPKISPNFRSINFTDFNATLKTWLDQDSTARHIATEQEFHNKVNTLTKIIQEMINAKVPLRKPSPYAKRWWNADLLVLKKKKNQLSYKAHNYRDIVNHPSLAEHKRVSKKLAKAIEDATKSHWVDWLENISAQDVYLANKYVTNEPTDYSNARIPAPAH